MRERRRGGGTKEEVVNKFPRGERRTDEVENASRLWIPAGLGWDWKLCQGRLRKRRMSQELLHAHVRTRARRSRFLADTRGHQQQLSTVETRVNIETTCSPKNKICTRCARVLLKSKLGTDSELLGVIAGITAGASTTPTVYLEMNLFSFLTLLVPSLIN